MGVLYMGNVFLIEGKHMFGVKRCIQTVLTHRIKDHYPELTQEKHVFIFFHLCNLHLSSPVLPPSIDSKASTSSNNFWRTELASEHSS